MCAPRGARSPGSRGPARPDRHRHGPRSPDPEDPAGADAQGIFDGLENGDEDIFPDPMSAPCAEAWGRGITKQLERQNATLVQTQPLEALFTNHQAKEAG